LGPHGSPILRKHHMGHPGHPQGWVPRIISVREDRVNAREIKVGTWVWCPKC
jgi:hypothetical protein